MNVVVVFLRVAYHICYPIAVAYKVLKQGIHDVLVVKVIALKIMLYRNSVVFLYKFITTLYYPIKSVTKIYI